jgi:hypothetical protein
MVHTDGCRHCAAYQFFHAFHAYSVQHLFGILFARANMAACKLRALNGK